MRWSGVGHHGAADSVQTKIDSGGHLDFKCEKSSGSSQTYKLKSEHLPGKKKCNFIGAFFLKSCYKIHDVSNNS